MNRFLRFDVVIIGQELTSVNPCRQKKCQIVLWEVRDAGKGDLI